MMPEKYDFAAIESRWQKRWEDDGVFCASEDHSKPKYYILVEFPYPSGEGLHVGHPRSYTALDVVARKRRGEGYNVLYPIGWDAFGLPAENYAIKTGEHPRDVTVKNIANFRRQLKRLGFSFDWSREVDTTHASYYKWTQWIFLKLWEKGLAYKSEIPINWCTSCNVGLANEEVVGGVCERCDGEVVRRVQNQWMLKITDYAERLISDLDSIDFLEKIKLQQKHWIGKSTGAEVDFSILAEEGKQDIVRVFTTRPDTLFGVTYMVFAPEHSLVGKFLPSCENADEVRSYIDAATKKSDFERTETVKEITGVEMKGVHAKNPANGEAIPVWIADYVIISYGTGAIMAVPGHDERDWRFAKQYHLPMIEVISGGELEKEAFTDIDSGMLVNSGPINDLKPSDAIIKMSDIIVSEGYGRTSVQYRLRDWVFSRQRYWGEPIPIVQCSACGWVPLPEDQLPLELPDLKEYRTTKTGESPLALIEDWVNTACPQCGGPAKRETDTMPQWAGSSWYFLRYIDPGNRDVLASRESIAYWMPVDWYNGGMEHTTLHLLYSRFWHKFLYDIGVVHTAEPYLKRTSHGLILGENREKMSKSRGNVVNPDALVDQYGADAFRLYEMFMGAFDQAIPWSTQGLIGMFRFLQRVWQLQNKVSADGEKNRDIDRIIHITIKQVGERIESMKFNTAIAALMTLINELSQCEKINADYWETFLILLGPFAPHISEEMWARRGKTGLVATEKWPEYDEAAAASDEVEIAVQVNGKLRATVVVDADASEEAVIDKALKLEKIKKQIQDKDIVKKIFVPGRLLNVVLKS